MPQKNRRWQLTAPTLVALLALFLTLLNYGFYRTLWRAWQDAGGDGTFLWTVPLFIFFALNILLHLLLLPWLHKILMPLILLLSAAVSYSVIFLGIYFDRAMLTNVLITTPAEGAKLLTWPLLLWLLAFGVVPAILYLRVRLAYRRWWRELLQRLGAVALSLLALLLIARFHYQDYAAFSRNNPDIHHLIVPTNYIVAGVSKIKHARRAQRPLRNRRCRCSSQQTRHGAPSERAHHRRGDPRTKLGTKRLRAANHAQTGGARRANPQLPAHRKLRHLHRTFPALHAFRTTAHRFRPRHRQPPRQPA